MNKIGSYLAELRAPFFTGSIVPVVLGSAVAWRHGAAFDWSLFFLTLAGAVLIHAAANVMNDYYDHKSGTDAANTEFASPFTGGSRMIQKGLLSPREVFIEGVLLYAAGAAIGLWLAFTRGLPILYIGIIGTVTSFFYTAPPFKFVHRGAGEIFIALNFGLLPTLGAYYVQTQELSWIPVIASVPIAILIMLILYINEFQDHDADRSVGKNHWVVRLGRRRASFWYAVFLGIVYVSIAAGVLLKVVPTYALAALLTLPVAFKAVVTTRTNYDDPKALTPANAMTIKLHLIIGLIISASFLI